MLAETALVVGACKGVMLAVQSMPTVLEGDSGSRLVVLLCNKIEPAAVDLYSPKRHWALADNRGRRSMERSRPCQLVYLGWAYEDIWNLWR